MILILKNIPAKTKKQDIKDFIEPVVKGGWLNKTGLIKSISILPLKNSRTRIIHFHGLIEILPDTVAERVIRKLNRKVMAGKFVSLSEYKTRSLRNDSRYRKKNLHDATNDRRTFDRRDEYDEAYSEEIRILLFK
jgi:hypothetical protein